MCRSSAVRPRWSTHWPARWITSSSPRIRRRWSQGSQQFTAQGYDADDNPIPNLPFTWSVVDGGGTIDSSGLFTAGADAGIYRRHGGGLHRWHQRPRHRGGGGADTGSLHHRAHRQPAVCRVPVPVTITARDMSGNLLMGYGGPAALSDSTGTIDPADHGSFTGGRLDRRGDIGQAAHDVTITVTDGGATGTSNPFDVEAMPTYYQVTSPSYNQPAGQSFPVTVTAYEGTTVNCWEDDHQDPVLATTTDPVNLVNTECPVDRVPLHCKPAVPRGHGKSLRKHRVYRRCTSTGMASRTGGMRSLPTCTTMQPCATSSATRRPTPARLRGYSGGAAGDQCREYSLGTVEVTDNQVHFYVNNAQLLTAGGYDIFGWASIRLVPDPTPRANDQPLGRRPSGPCAGNDIRCGCSHHQ